MYDASATGDLDLLLQHASPRIMPTSLFPNFLFLFATNFLILTISNPLSVRRNRLENNTEHWNALLLSLRELIEWVIRKDTELTGLGPVCGDVAALQKQQVSLPKNYPLKSRAIR